MCVLIYRACHLWATGFSKGPWEMCGEVKWKWRQPEGK